MTKPSTIGVWHAGQPVVERRPIDKQSRALANPNPPADKPLREALERIAARIDRLDWRNAESFCLHKDRSWVL
jgi:hypothetical protein